MIADEIRIKKNIMDQKIRDAIFELQDDTGIEVDSVEVIRCASTLEEARNKPNTIHTYIKTKLVI